MQNKNGRYRIFDKILNKFNLGLREKLIIIFISVKIIPLILVAFLAWQQIIKMSNDLRVIAIEDASVALDKSAMEQIERLSTDTALKIADFLYERDRDILYVSELPKTPESFQSFINNRTGRIIDIGEWTLSEDKKSWEKVGGASAVSEGGISTNSENDDRDGFHYRHPDNFNYTDVPLYDEITFIDLNGQEILKYVADNSGKQTYKPDPELKNISDNKNTYVKAESYFDELKKLAPGEIYVSDVIGAYVGTNYIGMYVPEVVEKAASDRGYDIEYNAEEQAYSGRENPLGQKFEGIVRWATPVVDGNNKIVGYVSLALNHDHIMEFTSHITPTVDRYTEIPDAFDGNYAFIWDYKCRNISHPRHHSIVGFNPETGEPEIPWLEESIYNAWQDEYAESGISWYEYTKQNVKEYDEQSREKKPSPYLTQNSLVALDGRYLNNAPQCTGWMDLTEHGGSGSFYILWSGIYKLTTAAAIPYYTGQYSQEAAGNARGFGFVAIGSGLEDFQKPATEMGENLTNAATANLNSSSTQLVVSTLFLITLVMFIAIMLASYLTNNIKVLINGILRFESGERQFRFMTKSKDEFGTLADSFDDMADNIVNSTNSPLCITDLDKKIIYMNESQLALNKKTLDEVFGMYYKDNCIYPSGTSFCPIKALEEGREADVLYVEESDKYYKGTANYFLDKKNNRIGYIIITSDVTEMSKERYAIEEQSTLLDRIFTSSPDLIWYKNAAGKYLEVNPRFVSITGKTREQIIGYTSAEVLNDEKFTTFLSNDVAALYSKQPQYTEEKMIFTDTHIEILDTVRTPLYDNEGRFIGLLGYARNITARVEIESELRNAQNALETAVEEANRANEHKGEFLARMSHEIRTPMNAIMGITNILLKKLDEPLTEIKNSEAIAYVNQIESSSKHLLGLLNDILDLSKIEAGRIELTYEPTDLYKLAKTVTGIIEPRCQEKNIEFIFNIDEFGSKEYIADPLRLRQVLINLLGNAVKFTPANGKIMFDVTKKPSSDTTGYLTVEFSITDTGIGIAEDAQSSIFKTFEQADNRISKKFGGTGLGLSISNKIIELFGSEIKLQSKVGEGSKFSFTLSFEECYKDFDSDYQLQIESMDIYNKFATKKALLVDDIDINRMIMSSLLDETGIEITEANDGKNAVDVFAESADFYFDIILMDVQMPVMDGYEASKTIRSMDRPDAKSIPIVAITANAFKDDIDKALSFGMSAHLSKPIEMDKLLEIMVKYIR